MGRFIKVIKTGIDVSKVTKQLRKNPSDWGHQEKSEGVRSLVNEHGFDDLPIGNLQLTIGAVQKKEDFVGDSELSVIHLHIKIILKFLNSLERSLEM